MVTASWMPLIIDGSLMRATPPSRRMSDGTRSSAITAAAPASSAIFACSASTTSMMTPPLSISASPALTRKVASSRIWRSSVDTRQRRRPRRIVPNLAPGLRRCGVDPLGPSRRPCGLLEPEGLDAVGVLVGVAAVDAVGQRLDDRQQRGVRAHVGRRVARVVQLDLRELGHLRQRGVDDRQRARLAVARELHRPDDERMRPPGRQADDQRVLVDAPQAAQGLLRRAGDDLGAQVQQHQQVTQVGGEEGHLIRAADQDAVGGGDRVDRRLHVGARHPAGRLLHVLVVGGDGRLELVLVQREQRLGRGPGAGRADGPGGHLAAVLLARGVLQLGEALEAQRLREADDRRARGVGAPRQLLGRLEGDLVEVVDDVLRHILLGARELVEARLDVGRQGLVAPSLVRRGGNGRGRPLYGGGGLLTPALRSPSELARSGPPDDPLTRSRPDQRTGRDFDSASPRRFRQGGLAQGTWRGVWRRSPSLVGVLGASPSPTGHQTAPVTGCPRRDAGPPGYGGGCIVRSREVFDVAAERSRVGFRARVDRLRTLAPTLLLGAVAAGASWEIASRLFGHTGAFFAPVAAIITLGLTVGQRLRRGIEVSIGVPLGIALADVLVLAVGSGWWQLVLIVMACTSAAVLVGGGPLLVTQAAVSACLVVTLQPPTNGLSFTRAADALIGCGVALILTFVVVPIDPLRLVRREAEPVLRELAGVLEDVAAALERRERPPALAALRRARDIDAHTQRMLEALTIGQETAAAAPQRRAAREHLTVYGEAGGQLDLAVRN